jgi:hypothetical protein
MNIPGRFSSTADKYIAARNALIAKYTFEHMADEQQRKVDEHIVDMLILAGLDASRAAKYKLQLRETQYYGMAAAAMAFLGIPPALPGILFRERWAHVPNPLVALTSAQLEIEMASNEILRKHRIRVAVSDAEERGFNWEEVLPDARNPKGVN